MKEVSRKWLVSLFSLLGLIAAAVLINTKSHWKVWVSDVWWKVWAVITVWAGAAGSAASEGLTVLGSHSLGIGALCTIIGVVVNVFYTIKNGGQK